MQFSRLEMARIQFIESHKTELFLSSYLWSDAWYCSRWPGDRWLASWIPPEAGPGPGSEWMAAGAADRGGRGGADACCVGRGRQGWRVSSEALAGLPWVLRRGQRSCLGTSLAVQTSRPLTGARPAADLWTRPRPGWHRPLLQPAWHAQWASLRHTGPQSSPLWDNYTLISLLICFLNFLRSLDHITYFVHHKIRGDL